MNIVSQYYRRLLLSCLITAVVETILVLSIAEPLVLILVLGPLAFLALLAARRRTHLSRVRRLHGVSIGIGTFGITALGVAFLTSRRDPNAEAVSFAPLVVPIVQWLVVLWAWIAIARAEAAEKRAAPQP